MMKRIIILLVLISIIITSLIGYKIVAANIKIKEQKDIITYQESKEKYLTHYNYTLDNPNIVLNPYNNSPLTALIIFETSTEEEIYLTITGKDDKSTYKNKFKKNKIHYIPIYGLYANYNNKIIIKCGNLTKEYTIKTDKLPNNLQPIKKDNNTNELYFIENENYIYALDNNNEVRWYMNNTNKNKLSRLSNGNMLLSTKTLIDSTHSTGLVEIDLLGKIYKEYDINKGYYGSYTEKDNSIIVLSKDLLEINKQTGKVINTIKLDNNYLTVDVKDNKIILKNKTKTKEIDYNTKEEKEYLSNNEFNNDILLPLYSLDDYKITKGTKFINKPKTKLSKKNILLLNYKKTDNNYKKHKIKLTKEVDRLVLNGSFNKNEKAYLILDKFLDKKVYDIKSGLNYINQNGLNGDYSIYIKIDNKIYKTNNYVTF